LLEIWSNKDSFAPFIARTFTSFSFPPIVLNFLNQLRSPTAMRYPKKKKKNNSKTHNSLPLSLFVSVKKKLWNVGFPKSRVSWLMVVLITVLEKRKPHLNLHRREHVPHYWNVIEIRSLERDECSLQPMSILYHQTKFFKLYIYIYNFFLFPLSFLISLSFKV
jgi:hypothetical protein